MANSGMNYTIRSDVRKKTLINNLTGGLCINETTHDISDNQSPDMLNMWYDNKILSSRSGQRLISGVGKAHHSLYMKNVFSANKIDAANLDQFIKQGANCSIETENDSLKFTINALAGYQGFLCSVNLRQNRKYVISFSTLTVGTQMYLYFYNNTFTSVASNYMTTVATGDYINMSYAYNPTVDSDYMGIMFYNVGVHNVKNINVYDITDNNFNLDDRGTEYMKIIPHYDDMYFLNYPENFSHLHYCGSFKDVLLKHSDNSITSISYYDTGSNLNGFYNEFFHGYLYFHINDSLYRWNGDEKSVPVLLKKEFLSNEKTLMFIFLNKLYLMNEHDYFEVHLNDTLIDGIDNDRCNIINIKEVEPYVPTVMVNMSSSGDGDLTNEKFNLIGKAYKMSYNVTANTVSYSFRYTKKSGINASAGSVKVYLNNVLQNSSTYNVSFNETIGSISFHSGYVPTVNGINNLQIQIELSSAEHEKYKTQILKCTMAKSFGGGNYGGTRLIMAGNPEKRAHYFRSGLLNCSYFPDMDYDIIGAGNDDITAMNHQHGTLVMFTENSVYQMLYDFDSTTASFPVKQLSSGIGCDIPGSVQLIDNKLVFANTKNGVYIIDYFNNSDEKSIKQISANINGSSIYNKGLLYENHDDLKNAISTFYNGCYFLTVNSRTYVWDYRFANSIYSGEYYDSSSEDAQRKLVWYFFDNITAEAYFKSINGQNLMFFTHNKNVKLKGDLVNIGIFDDKCNDFGEDINSYFYTKSFNFSLADVSKILNSVEILSVCKSKNFGDSSIAERNYGGNIKVELYCDNKKPSTYNANLSTYSWDTFNWESFSFIPDLHYNLQKIKFKPQEGLYFSFKFHNPSGAFNVAQIIIDYTPVNA